MKAKSLTLKVLSCMAVVALAFAALAGTFTAKVADAAEAVTSKNYFKVNGTGISATFTQHGSDGVLQLVTAGKNDVAVYQPKVAANDLSLSFYVDDEVESLDVSFETAPYYVNYEEENVTSKFTLKNEGGTLKLTAGNNTISGGAYSKDTAVTLSFQVDGNKIGASFDGVAYVYTDATDASAYVENFDKTIATLSFGVNYKQEPTASGFTTDGVELVYVDNARSETTGKHKQTFVIEGTATAPEEAYPIIDLDNSFVKQAADGSLAFVKYTEYTFAYSVYQPLPNTTKKTVEFAENEYVDLYKTTSTTSKKASFKDGATELKIVDTDDNTKVYATYGLTLLNADNDAYEAPEAPVYADATAEVTAYDLFKKALDKATKVYDEDGDYVEEGTDKKYNYIEVGSGKYLTIPSMENLVSDNFTAYDKLSYTVHYMKKDASTSFATYSSLKVPVNEAGTYVFFVTFKDKYGNEMKEEQFYNKEAEGFDTTGCEYAAYVFEFTVEGETEISVKAQNASKDKAENWSKGVTRTAKSFTIESGAGDTETYSLYYEVSEGNWVEIVKYDSEKVANYYTDMYADEAIKYTDEDIKTINYNGQLKFTPNKTGMYKIVCNVYDDNSSYYASATTYIKASEVTVVVPATPSWVEENLASFIFLIIGGIALIGLIVVAFIKPKDEEPVNKKKTSVK